MGSAMLERCWRELSEDQEKPGAGGSLPHGHFACSIPLGSRGTAQGPTLGSPLQLSSWTVNGRGKRVLESETV